jgi:ribosomal protein L15
MPGRADRSAHSATGLPRVGTTATFGPVRAQGRSSGHLAGRGRAGAAGPARRAVAWPGQKLTLRPTPKAGSNRPRKRSE